MSSTQAMTVNAKTGEVLWRYDPRVAEVSKDRMRVAFLHGSRGVALWKDKVYLATVDGRLINGVMPAEADRTITLQTPTERIVIDRDDIEALQPSGVSMMPEGLLDTMTADQRRDLFGYLMSEAR